MNDKTFASVIWVVTRRVDGTEPPHVWHMFYPDKRSNFSRSGLTFSWLNKTLTVCGRGCQSLELYGQEVEIRNASGVLFQVSAFSTEGRARKYLSTPTPTDASAS